MKRLMLGALSWRAHETLRKTLWRRRHFRIAVGEGCFTHNRFDDSFRPNHAAYNVEIVDLENPRERERH